MKTSCSVIRTSAWPSPSRSTNRRFGSSQAMLGSCRNGRNGCPVLRRTCARRSPGVGPASATRSSWPSPARSRSCWRPLLSAAREGFAGDAFRAARTRPPPRLRLVEPGAGLLRQDAGDALAVQVDPLVGRPVEARGQVLEALGVELENLILDALPCCTRTRAAAATS